MTIRAILTDIEGTASSINFVKDVLFPYAYENMENFLLEHFEDERIKSHALAACKAEQISECNPHNASKILRQWIERDLKVTPLKEIQGIIWEAGYQKGEFSSHVYLDAWEKLQEWHQRGLPIYVYSSGSIHAQKMFFSHSCFGNILNLFSGFFDTTTGSKKESNSYKKIADLVNLMPEEIMFLSDLEAELNAARRVGMKTTWVVRQGDLPANNKHQIVRNFGEIKMALLD